MKEENSTELAEKRKLFQGLLKKAVEAYGDKMYDTKIWDNEENDDYEYGMQVTTFFNFDGKKEELIFGTYTYTDGGEEKAPIWVWFNIDDDNTETHRISQKLENKLLELYENQQGVHGTYIQCLDKWDVEAHFYFALKEQYCEKVRADDVSLDEKQEILTQFFKEVMDIVLKP